MDPLHQYQSDRQQGLIHADPTQEAVVLKLNALYQSLCDRHVQGRSWWTRLKAKLGSVRQPLQGLYLWGSVGIGKTYLMDLFYETLPVPKMRIHFHRFMQMVHDDLKKLQGLEDPLEHVAKRFASKAHVICFDECLVNDIADAMLLAGLLRALLQHHVCLVMTSNTQPDQLYANGLQRALFLPAIELIKTSTDVIHMVTKTDYRLRNVSEQGVYFFPLGEAASRAMHRCFKQYTLHATPKQAPLIIHQRAIAVIASTDDVAWFDFNELCHVPRSQQDYLEIARLFNTVLVSNVPAIAADNITQITYFIYLVDVLYDARVKLILSAATPIADIYPQGTCRTAFERTQSRLIEMQSHHYWHEAHHG